MLLQILLIATTIISLAIFAGYIWDNDDVRFYGYILLAVLVLFGWVFAGFSYENETKYKILSDKSLEILVGENKIFITEYNTNKTYIFDDAKTYNFITDTTKKYYVERLTYSMYGLLINNEIIITDTLLPKYKTE